MSLELYEKAKKMGMKAYKSSVSKGQSPYLPVLDDIIKKEDIASDVSLGLMDIPLDRVVGTATAGRTQAFAANFMPIMGEKTEFGAKWSSLCDSHLEEGIRDAIKVYEYLNYYYVVEGNKRVSVLKFFEADSITAFVTRKVPKPSDDEIIKVYYEFMDFNKKTGVNSICFSQQGSYKRLMDAVRVAEKHGGELETTETLSAISTASDSADGTGTVLRAETSKIWSEDTLLEIKAAYRRFAKAFKANRGDSLDEITTGDAFLAFLELNGFDAVCEMSVEDIRAGIKSMWQEFMMINEKQDVDFSMVPPESKKKVLSQLLTPSYSASKPLKVAFIYNQEATESDWIYAHELGRNHIKEVFGDKLVTLRLVIREEDDELIYNTLEELVESEKVDVVFTTTAQMIDASLKCAIDHPDVKVLNCSINTSHRYIRPYAARLYEPKFLSGMVAGALTKTDKIGYLTDYPIYGNTANINAFALGAKMVNPDAKVYLNWTTLRQDIDDIYKSFIEEGIDYISDQDLITPNNASRKFGLYKLEGPEPVNMTMAVYDWGELYEQIINIIMDGNWNDADADSESKAINYFWGLSAGVVDLIISDKVPVETRRLVETIKQLMIRGEFDAFGGEIYSQAGKLRSEDGEDLSVDDIIKMNWLVDNIVGEIPNIESFSDRAKSIVEMKGVK